MRAEQDARADTITLKIALQDEKKTDIREESSKLTKQSLEGNSADRSQLDGMGQTNERTMTNWKDLCMIRIKKR